MSQGQSHGLCLRSRVSSYHDLLIKDRFIAHHRMTGQESEAIFLCRPQSVLLRLEQVPFCGHEHIIKPLLWDYSQDDEILVAKCMTKQRDYKGLCSVLL